MESRGRSKRCYEQPGSGQGLCVRRRGHRRVPRAQRRDRSRCCLAWDRRAVRSSGQLQPVVIHISASNPFLK